MAIKILGNSSELTLIFNRPTFRCSHEQIRFLGETLRQVTGVESVETRSVWYRAPRIRIVFDARTESNTILRRMALALRSWNESENSSDLAGHHARGECLLENILSVKSLSDNDSPSGSSDQDRMDLNGELGEAVPPARNRVKEAGYGVLAIGTFTMSWIGLVLPVVPTIPFVVLTAHFAVQSSPRLRNRLLRSRVFGPMMRDWQEHRAIRRVVQLQAYFFTLIIIVIGFVLAPAIPLIYGIMVIGSFMALFAISQIPLIEPREVEATPSLSYGLLNMPTVVS